MRIQHNIMAMSAYRNYTNNVSAMKANLEKLSSGYKINRAGDDAAGLAISEKMRAQITGLETAQKNAKDGISLVQTAEGALTEVHDMLNRMVELATQSANGTYDNETDRAQLQKEMDQLNEEINRIADSSNFNGIKLLDGSLGLNTDAFQIGTVGTVDATPATAVIKTAMPTAGSTKGTNTILHTDGTSAQLGHFTIDVSQLSLAADGATAAAVDVTINGAVTFAITAADTATSLDGKSIATAIAGKASGANYLIVSGGNMTLGTADDIQAGDLIYQATDNQDGTVTFNAVGYGSAAKTFTAFTDSNLDKLSTDVTAANLGHVGVTVGAAKNATSSGADLTGAENLATTKTVDTTAAEAGTFGNTKLVIDATKITEGMTITIAGETHTFGDGSGQIKISDLDLSTATGEGAKELTERIAQAFASNAQVSVGADTNAAGTLTLAEKTDGQGESTASATYQEKMSTLDGFKSMVSFENPAQGAGTTLKLADSSKLTKGDVISVGEGSAAKQYVYGTDFTDMASLAAKMTSDGFNAELNTDGDTITIRAAAGQSAPPVLGKGLTLQIGDTADPYNQLNVAVKDCHTSSLGLDSISIADQESAAKAIDAIKAAINYVSDVRGTLGATQNRLDHTINNLSVMTENIQDAESTIRDTDVAEEMMAYTKNNILIQSAQAMLAQANQVPQGVLQLLQ